MIQLVYIDRMDHLNRIRLRFLDLHLGSLFQHVKITHQHKNNAIKIRFEQAIRQNPRFRYFSHPRKQRIFIL